MNNSRNSVDKGISYFLPNGIKKNISFIDVGVYEEGGKLKEINKFFNLQIKNLYRVNTYIFIHSCPKEKFSNIQNKKPFLDPAVHNSSKDFSLALDLNLDFDYYLHTMLKLGTSDAEGNIAYEQALIAAGQDMSQGDAGFLATNYFFKGDLTEEQIEAVSNFIANPELYQKLIVSKDEYCKGIEVEAPLVVLENKVSVEKFAISEFDDMQLLELNSKKKLAATLPEMQHFKQVYQDQKYISERKKYGLDERATDVELESWFGLRSEHCFHKEFNALLELEIPKLDCVFEKAVTSKWLEKSNNQYKVEKGIFKTFIQEPAEKVYDQLEATGQNWIASMFSDNSGVVYYDDEYMYCLKVETHNSPSNIEPVQGAKTGLNGNFRDIMGTMQGTFDILMGFFFYCTGHPNYSSWLPKGVKHPYVLLKGITRGVREAGNEMQIPTLAGGVVCDPRYIAKCLVYCGAVGWSPIKSLTGIDYRLKEPEVGNHIIVAGQAVGVDGIHGATESSLSASREISLGHVQADFSFIQAKVKEFILDASRQGLFTAVTDFGAMGLGSASHETARATGGLDMDLAKHPVKYQGILPWQINCSETQDRMLLVAKNENLAKILKLAEFYNISVSDLGILNDSGYVHLTYSDETVALIDINKLFDKNPKKVMSGFWKKKAKHQNQEIKLSLQEKVNLVLSEPEVASKEWFFRQKDFSVKGGTIIGPLYGKNLDVDTDAAIQKPLETYEKDKGAIAYAICAYPKLTDYDSYLAVQKSYLDVVGKILALGAKLPDLSRKEWNAWAMCGNYCQPNSDSKYTLCEESGKENLAELVREGIAVRELIEEFNIPVISGKDSMKCSCVYEVGDDFDLSEIDPSLAEHIKLIEKDGKKKIEIHDPETYLVSLAVKLENYERAQNPEFKASGDLVYLLGETKKELGGSAYYSGVGYKLEKKPIKGYVEDYYDISAYKQVAKDLQTIYEKNILASSAYIHSGGLISALVKASFASELGLELDFSSGFADLTLDEILFSESSGRFIVSIDPNDKQKFEKLFSNTKPLLIGKVSNTYQISIKYREQIEKIDLMQAKKSYQKAFDFGGLK